MCVLIKFQMHKRTNDTLSGGTWPKGRKREAESPGKEWRSNNTKPILALIASMCVNENVCSYFPSLFVLAFLHFSYKTDATTTAANILGQVASSAARFSRTNAKFLAINFIPGLPTKMFSSLRRIFLSFFFFFFLHIWLGSICFVMVLIKF